MKIENTNDIAAKLTEALAPFVDRLHGLDVEATFEDKSEWPIAPWKIDNYENEDIGRAYVVVRIFADGYDCGQCLRDITAAAKTVGIDLTESGNARHRDGAQINLQTADIQ